MDIDLSQYMGMYVEGSRENLDLMDKHLLCLEQDPDSVEAINEIFRAAHTLKGMSATMNFDKVTKLTHEMETVLDKLRTKEVAVNTDLIDALFETFDLLRVLVNDCIDSTDSDVDFQPVVDKLYEAMNIEIESDTEFSDEDEITDSGSQTCDKLSHIQDIEINEFDMEVLYEAVHRKHKIYLVIVTLVADCLLKAPRAFIVSRTLEELDFETIKSVPPTKDIEEEKFDLSFKMLVVGTIDKDSVKKAIEEISEIDSTVVIEYQPEDFRSDHTSDLSPSQIVEALDDSQPKPSGQSASAKPAKKGRAATKKQQAPKTPVSKTARRSTTSTQTKPVSQPSAPPSSQQSLNNQASASVSPEAQKPPTENSPATASSAVASSPAPQTNASKEKKFAQTVRVDMRRLDELMNLVGELVINRTRLDDIGAAHKLKELNEALSRVSQISSSLQNVVMQVRMVPVEHVFDRFPRMVRDLSKKLNKKINLVVEGKETEMDRTVIDEIGDPMVHLIRNAIDHGIESPTQRLMLGKPEAGTITLVARHEGNNVIIEVKDDGKGVDPSIVGRLAVERGLFTAEQIAQMPPEEIIRIIFMPGFSTAAQVSDLSGRGVGMDAVKARLEDLNGQLEIESKIGEGTKILIKLPLTLAILPALMVKVGKETFAIPLGMVQETIDICKSEINIVQHHEVTLLRGDVLPIIRLRNVLNVPTTKEEHEQINAREEEISIVVCASGDKWAGFMVDELLGQQEIVIKSLGNLLGGLPGIMGATMRGDGTIALILDIPAFFQRGQTI